MDPWLSVLPGDKDTCVTSDVHLPPWFLRKAALMNALLLWKVLALTFPFTEEKLHLF